MNEATNKAKPSPRVWIRTEDFCLFVRDLRDRGYTKKAIAEKAKEKFNLNSCHENTVSAALSNGKINFKK